MSLIRATLAAPDDFSGWRDQARAFLEAGIAPERIVWAVANDAAPDLFGEAGSAVRPMVEGHAIRVPRELLALLQQALLHSAPSRFALGYRLLWRRRTAVDLHLDPSDPDMIALHGLAKAVRRDIHKMHAFVRFRKIGVAAGREQFAAWFEPDHHIARAAAGFFRDRFAGMDWLIVTPEASIGWDGATLREGPGGTRADVPGEDAVEAEWRAYYANIFNPARLKVGMMKREMPVRYWRNLPEAVLIGGLVQEAGHRFGMMVEGQRQVATEFAPIAPAERHFDSLDALYGALAAEDAAPSSGFSERIVFGEGPPQARLMLVGEQPGEQEDSAGRPFVGPAGQLLDQCLGEAGVAREGAYLTNAVKRFKFIERGRRRIHQTPSSGDIAHYRWWLAEEIRLVAPKLVVALGATALHALSGRKQALGPVRGTTLPWGERQLMPTIHPSFLLRLPDEQARHIERGRFVRDLRRAMEAASVL